MFLSEKATKRASLRGGVLVFWFSMRKIEFWKNGLNCQVYGKKDSLAATIGLVKFHSVFDKVLGSRGRENQTWNVVYSIGQKVYLLWNKYFMKYYFATLQRREIGYCITGEKPLCLKKTAQIVVRASGPIIF